MIIGTIVNNNAFVHWEFVQSILNLPKYEWITWQGPSLPDNRNRIYEQARMKTEDLLFIDSDLVFTPEQVARVEKLLEDHDVVTGIYLIGKEPKMIPAIFEMGKYDYKFVKPKEGVNEIGACGGGFLGISKRVYDKLPSNPFSNIREGDIVQGEDISFGQRLSEAGIKLWCDSSLRLGHIRKMVKYYEV
jgi:hypothetical protein